VHHGFGRVLKIRLGEWFVQRGFPADKVYQVLDYTHAKQHLNELLNLVPAAERDAVAVDWKIKLWEGEIDALKQGIKTMVTRGKKRKKALKHWESYFETNAKRMCYSSFKKQGLVCGSGCVESAIRRVINLRLKAPGSFWLKEMAEAFLFLHSQFISGRWNLFVNNVTTHHSVDCFFRLFRGHCLCRSSRSTRKKRYAYCSAQQW